MMQLNSLGNHSAAEYDDVSSTNPGLRLSEVTTGSYPDVSSGLGTGGAPYLREHGFGSVINWGSDLQSPAGRSASSLGHGHSTDQPGLNHGLDQCGQSPVPDQSGQVQSSDDEEYRPFTPPPPRERLSYTRYQLALLNGIYQEVRYPNGTQKQLIAKRVGITREQVKIWFQNRRRKDVVTKVGGSKSESKDRNNPQTVITDSSTCSNTQTSQDAQGNTENQIEHSKELQREVTPNPNSGEEQSNDRCRANINEKPGAEVGEGRSYRTNQHIDGLSSASSTNSLSPAAVSSQVLSPLSSVPSPQIVSPTTMAASQLVSPVVLRSMIMELNKFDNNYLKQKKSKKKRSKPKSAKAAPAPSLPPNPKLLSSLPSFSSLSSCQTPRLFQNYDMIAPPNKLTPSANRTLHASETSAFRNPRGNKVFITSNENPTWAGPVIATPNSAHPLFSSSDFIHQSFPSDGLRAEGNPSTQTHLTNHLPSSAVATLSHASPTQASMYSLIADHLSSSAAQRTVCSSSPASRQPEPGVQTSGQSDLDSRVEGANGSDEHRSLRAISTYPYHSPLAHHPFSFHHSSHFPAFNHVLPFPLIAEPPMVLSSIGQADVQRQAWHYATPHQYLKHPSPHSNYESLQGSQTSHHSTQPNPSSHAQNSAAPTSALPSHLGSHSSITALPYHLSSQAQSSISALPHHLSSQAQSSVSSISELSQEAYRPLMISSLSNPYFTPTSLPYTPSQSALSNPPHMWVPGSDLNPNGYTGM